MTLSFFIGLLASVLISWLSFTTKQRTVLVLSVLVGAVTSLQYAILGQPVAVAMGCIGLVYALAMLLFSDRIPGLTKPVVTVGLLSAYTAVFFTLNGVAFNLQLLSYVGSVTMVAVTLIKDPFAVKWLMLVAGVAWSIFQYQIGAYSQLIGQAVFFVGVLWSFYTLTRARRTTPASVADARERIHQVA